MHRLKHALLLTGSSLALGASALGQSIAVDQFTDPDPDLLGNGGGEGWTGNWVGAGGANAVLSGGSAGYVDSQGNALNTAGDRVGLGGTDTGTFRSLAATVSGTDGTSVYVSFTLSLTVDASTYAGLSLFSGASTAGTERLFVGQPNGIQNWGFQQPAGPTATDATPITEGDLAFLVLRLDFLPGNDLARLYVNPTLGVEPATANAAPTSILSIAGFDAVRIQSGNLTTAVIDELRLGSTYASVTPFTPVPEPGTYALALLGGAGLFGAVRRSRRRHAACPRV